MSIAEVDRLTYDNILTASIAWYVDRGLDLKAARQCAQTEMDHAFRCADAVMQNELQRDADDYGRPTDARRDESHVVFRGGTDRDAMK